MIRNRQGRVGRSRITSGKCLHVARVIVAILLLFFCTALAFAQQDQNVSEYELKAAFLYNFARFVDWQSANGDSNMLFCIASDEAVSTQVKRTLAGRNLGSRKVQIQQLRHGADVTQCSVIFVTESAPREFQSVCSQIADMEILTVSETRDFLRRGCIVNFYGEHEHVRFEISVQAADRAGIKLSSKLMSLGRVIRGKASGAQ